MKHFKTCECLLWCKAFFVAQPCPAVMPRGCPRPQGAVRKPCSHPGGACPPFGSHPDDPACDSPMLPVTQPTASGVGGGSPLSHCRLPSLRLPFALPKNCRQGPCCPPSFSGAPSRSRSRSPHLHPHDSGRSLSASLPLITTCTRVTL